MTGAIELVRGDLFEGPSDLIVVPCSTVGSVTGFVRERMSRFALPRVPTGMKLGGVQLLSLTGAEHVAQFVAYAASVHPHRRSTPEAIRHIGAELGRVTHQEAIQVIHCPLLGAGAGRMPVETVVDELTRGFTAESKAPTASTHGCILTSCARAWIRCSGCATSLTLPIE